MVQPPRTERVYKPKVFSMGNIKAALRFPNWPQRRSRAGKFVVRLSQARLETPRLRLRPVISKGRVDLAFELIQLAGIKTGLQLPRDLSSQSFRSKLVGDEPFALFLVEEKVGGELIGLVGVWAISPSRGWPQILYAVRPELKAANKRLLDYARAGGVLIVQYNLQDFDQNYGPYPFTLGNNPQKVVDEGSKVRLLKPESPAFTWPNRITEADFSGWVEERGHGFIETWDARYEALVETNDPDQDPQRGGLLLARCGKGAYIYDAFALYRQLPSGVPGAYRILANLVSLGKNPAWRAGNQ